MESYPAQASAKKIVITKDLSPIVMPPLDDRVKSILFDVTCDEFAANPHVTKEVEITFPISHGYFMEPVSSTMQQQVLRGVRKRAEVSKIPLQPNG